MTATGVEELRPGVYDVTVATRGRARYRVHYVANAAPICFDTGFADTADALADALEDAGFAPEHVVVTHGDHDHVGGFETIADRFDATTHLPRESADPGFPVDDRYGPGDRIGPFEAIHVPGHKPDNYAWVDDGRGVLIAGDAVIGSDWRGLPPGYLLPPEAVYAADHRAAELHLERLLDYDFDAALVSHGSSVLDGAHEKLDAFVHFPGAPD